NAGADLTSEGFVELLSRNLDGVGGIRTVDPRTVLYRWKQRADEAALEPDSVARDIARSVRAGSVLTGSIVVLGDSVRIDAEVVPVDGGAPLATAGARGASDDLFRLVDDLSVDLLRGLWRASATQ